MGDVVRQETTKRGLELTPQNVGKVMLQLRAEGGNYVIAQKCIPKIEEQTSRKVLVDGLRSQFEADIFKENFTKFNVVAVHASPQTRFSAYPADAEATTLQNGKSSMNVTCGS